MKYLKRIQCAALSLCLLLALLPTASAANIPEKHLISVYFNDPYSEPGSSVSSQGWFDTPHTVTLPDAFERPGFQFLNWVDENGTVYQPGDTIWVTPDRDYRFYAQWKTVHPFTDLTGTEPYFGDVMYLLENGIMNGTSDSTFTPGTTFTRAMLWTVLARINGVDVDGGDPWYGKARAWAMAEGITDGTAPQRAVSVQELAAMLYRQAGSPEVSAVSGGFLADEWAWDGVTWALLKHLISLNTFEDASTVFVTRGELAVSLARFCELMEAQTAG